MRLIKAQSVAEYSICVGAIIILLVAMQAYVKRGLQGRYKDLVDTAARVTAPVGQRQYEPYYENTTLDAKVNITRDETTSPEDVRQSNISEEYNYTMRRVDSFEE